MAMMSRATAQASTVIAIELVKAVPIILLQAVMVSTCIQKE